MPAVLERCIAHVMAQGKTRDEAYPICRSSLNLAADGSQDEEAGETIPDDEIAEKVKGYLALAAIPARKDVNPKSGVNEYGKVPFADPVNKKYPIDTEEHIRAAWNYIHKGQNAAQYGAAALGRIKAAIASAWRSKIDKAGPPALRMTDVPFNSPTVRKWIPISAAVGEYVNGSQAGVLDKERLQQLVRNQQLHPRQIPVYLLTGKPDPDHPEDLDARFADGWIEGLKIADGMLMGDANLHGDAAAAVQSDSVRGASIGTVPGTAYDGSEIGEVLEHVVLTNQPFVKGMNIAASLARGGERVACYFTALPKEAKMADPKKKEPAPTGGDPENLQEKLEAAETLVAEQSGVIADLTASRDNAVDELETFKANPQLKEAMNTIKRLERHVLAEKVRRIVANMIADGQIVSEAFRAWYDNDSDEVVLAGFSKSQFKGKLDLMEYHRAAVTKKPRRSFVSGPSAEEGELTAEERKAAEDAGKDPDRIAAGRKATNLKDWKKATAQFKAAGKE